MNKLVISLFAGTSIFIISACSILPSPENIKILYYDIGFPAKTYNTDIGIQFSPIIGGIGDETKMVFREAPNTIQFDSFNRWSNSPSKLVQCYLLLALNNKKDTIDYVINGEIVRFDCDLTKKTANLAIKITIKSYKAKNADKNFVSQIIYTSSIPIEKKRATAYAEGMQKAMAEITNKIVNDLKHLKKK